MVIYLVYLINLRIDRYFIVYFLSISLIFSIYLLILCVFCGIIIVGEKPDKNLF